MSTETKVAERHLAASEQRKAPAALRFGVMCNGESFMPWEVDCIRSLLGLPRLHIALLIINHEAAGRRSAAARIHRIRLRTLLFNTYWELRIRPMLMRAVDLGAELEAIPKIYCTPHRRGRFSEYFAEPDIEQIKSYNLDFILRFGFGILRGPILTAAKYGIWSYHHDDEQRYRGIPSSFWEICQDDPVTGA